MGNYWKAFQILFEKRGLAAAWLVTSLFGILILPATVFRHSGNAFEQLLRTGFLLSQGMAMSSSVIAAMAVELIREKELIKFRGFKTVDMLLSFVAVVLCIQYFTICLTNPDARPGFPLQKFLLLLSLVPSAHYFCLSHLDLDYDKYKGLDEGTQELSKKVDELPAQVEDIQL